MVDSQTKQVASADDNSITNKPKQKSTHFQDSACCFMLRVTIELLSICSVFKYMQSNNIS